MKKLLTLSLLIILVACKKKETTPKPVQPTTTGSTPTGNTVKVVYTPGAAYGYLNIRWEHDYNTTVQDSVYTNPSSMTKTQMVQGDSIRVNFAAYTTTVMSGVPATCTIQVYVNNTLNNTWTGNGGPYYYKVK